MLIICSGKFRINYKLLAYDFWFVCLFLERQRFIVEILFVLEKDPCLQLTSRVSGRWWICGSLVRQYWRKF